MICKKCESIARIVLRNKDYYCDDCFMLNTNHKFRACIGKNKVLTPNENILTCLSGGLSSTVLLDLVHHSISLDNTKKLRINPSFLHLFDDNSRDIAVSVLEQCLKYNFNIYIAHISEYMKEDIQLPIVNGIADVTTNKTEFDDMLHSMPPSAANDFLCKVKHDLFVKFAKKLECTAIFTAETSNTLAINLLYNLAAGRGSQVQNDIGFIDNRDENVKILRPMRDISKEELDYYVTIKQLTPICKNNTISNSLQSVISSFVSDLQENSQSTISTICKTADKIGTGDKDKTHERCIICKSNLHTKDMKLSALEATNISRTVSFDSSHFRQDMEDSSDIVHILENEANVSMFPLINKYLCYGCSRNQSEMNQLKLPLHVRNILNL